MTLPDDSSSDDVSDEDGLSSESPFAPPPDPEPVPSTTDPSVFAEPWMEPVLHPEDARDPGPALPVTDQVDEDQSVWDEPGLSRPLSGDTPEDGVTWYRWYLKRVEATSAARSWLVTMATALMGGLFAIAGTLMQQSMGGGFLLGVVVFGPTVEEVMKVGLVLWLVEKQPWLYRNTGQILLCAFVSGCVFAAVENVLYLTVYIEDPPLSLIRWRWTVCVLLHSGCSAVAGLGACRIWQRFQQEQRAPVLADGAFCIVAAIVLHGLYNGTVTLLELGGLEF